jgi:tRNA A37 threonylcarbamoyladenosine dehydratase
MVIGMPELSDTTGPTSGRISPRFQMNMHPSPPIPRQFASTARLMPQEAFLRLAGAHVGVVGLGGVGSWAAEALARSGVGRLTLIDMDHVAESNINRQAQALHSTLGMAKAEALAGRIRDIAPSISLTVRDMFLDAGNAAGLLGPGIWIDATDDLRAKRAMILHLRQEHRLHDLIVSGGAGGKTDPTRITVADLSQTQQDPLLSSLRYGLRRHHGFARDGRMGVRVVFSPQPMKAAQDADPSARLACAGYGSMVTVTAAMGLAAAAEAMHRAASMQLPAA